MWLAFLPRFFLLFYVTFFEHVKFAKSKIKNQLIQSLEFIFSLLLCFVKLINSICFIIRKCSVNLAIFVKRKNIMISDVILFDLLILQNRILRGMFRIG